MAEPVKLEIVTAKQEANQNAVEALEDLLAMAKRGDIVEVMAIGTRMNGNYITVVTHGLDSLKRIGILESVKFDVLENRETVGCP